MPSARRFLTWLFVPVLLVAGSGSVRAQAARSEPGHATLLLQGVTVGDALDRLVAQTGISLVFDPRLAGAQRVYCRADDAPAETLLRCIVRAGGLDFYRLSSGTYVLIASPAEVPRIGSLAGDIVDATTGMPLPAARVALDGRAAREASASGAFAFAALPPGRYRLTAAAVGYRPTTTEIDLPPSTAVRQRVALTPDVVHLDQIVVNGLPTPDRAPSDAAVIVPDSLSRAFAGPDLLLRGASMQSGVAQRALLGDLHIQGGEAGEHQFRLDGFPVFDPVSLGRLLGAFSPLAIEQFTIRKAGFGTPFGSYSAGVIDLRQTTGDAQRPTATVAIDPSAINARLTTPWHLGSHRASAMLAGRTSLWDLLPQGPLASTLRGWTGVDRLLLDRFNGPVTGVPETTPFTPSAISTHLGFTDLHASTRIELGAFESVSASAYVGSNRAGTSVDAVASPPDGADVPFVGQDDFRWHQWGAQLRHDLLIGARTSTMVRVRASHHWMQHDQITLVGDTVRSTAVPPHEGNTVTELAAEASAQYAATSHGTLAFGVEAVRSSSTMVMADEVYRAMTSQSAAFRGAGFVQFTQQVGPRIWIEPGLRATWVPSRNTVYAEPRLSVRGEGDRTSWRIAGGEYRQFVNQFDVATAGSSTLVPSMRFWLPVDGTLAPPKAWHLTGEGVWRIAPTVELRAEGYYKWQPVILALDYDILLDRRTATSTDIAEAAFVAQAHGFAAGGGLRMVRTTGAWRMEAGYDYGVSRRTFPSRFDGLSQPTPWNEPHRALIATDWHATEPFTVSMRARGIWGRTWGLREAYYDLLSPSAQATGLPIGLPGNDHLPPIYELDVGTSYRTHVGGAQVDLGLALLNALDRRNAIDAWLTPVAGAGGAVTYAQVPRALMGRQLTASARMQW